MLKNHLKSRDSLSHIAEVIYPVGSIYVSTNSTSPATLFGFGTWTRIEGKFLLGATDNAAGSEASYAAGATGGAASVTLTAAQSGVPVHSHDNTIKATTPSLSHTITQPAFSTPSLSHSITQPVIANSGTCTTVSGEGAHWHGLSSNSNSIVHGGSTGTGSANIGSGSGWWYTNLNNGTHTHTVPNHTHTFSTNVGVANHAATACTRTTDVAVTAHAAADCTMSGSVSNNTATAAASAHTNMPPFQAVYIWYRSA